MIKTLSKLTSQSLAIAALIQSGLMFAPAAFADDAAAVAPAKMHAVDAKNKDASAKEGDAKDAKSDKDCECKECAGKKGKKSCKTCKHCKMHHHGDMKDGAMKAGDMKDSDMKDGEHTHAVDEKAAPAKKE